MRSYEIKLDIDPKNKYGKAWKSLLELDEALQDLTLQERKQLTKQYAVYKNVPWFYIYPLRFFLMR